MGEYLSPGLFLIERSASAGAIAGVSTSTYATAGWLRKGPENEPQLVTTFDRFVEIFGTYWRNSNIPFMMAAFFQNEGTRAYVTRVVPSDAIAATNASDLDDAATPASFFGRPLASTVDLSTDSYIAVKISGAAATEIDCAGAVPASTTPTEIASAIDAIAGISCSVGTGNRIEIVTDDTGATASLEFEDATANDATAVILGLDVSNDQTYLYEGEDASDWTLTSPWKGTFYNQVRMCLSGNNDYEGDNGGWTRFDVSIQSESAVGEADWQVEETYDEVVLDDDTDEHFIEDVVNGETNFSQITKGSDYNIPRSLRATKRLAEFLGEGDAAETSFSGTIRNPEVRFGTVSVQAGTVTGTDDSDGAITGTGIVSGTINYTTGAWTLEFSAAPADGTPIMMTYWSEPDETEVCGQLSGGTDGTGPLTRGDVTDPTLQASKTGLYSFDDLDEILNISMPDFAGNVTVSNDLIAYAETNKNRFAILTTEAGLEPTDAVKFVRNTAAYNTSYGALYYPWVKIYDPIADDGRNLDVPPDGFIAGVFARTDTNRNVGKAPAGITDGRLNGATGLERILSKGERDILYPARINPLVSTVQTGRAVWGAKTLSKDAEWINVNIRRLFMFCEQSVYNNSFWAVFENNGPGLWARIKAQGDGFFQGLLRDGYLKGATQAEAWFIKVDEENNPQASIDAGLLTVDYYIAGNKPAEFIRLRFQQKVAS